MSVQPVAGAAGAAKAARPAGCCTATKICGGLSVCAALVIVAITQKEYFLEFSSLQCCVRLSNHLMDTLLQCTAALLHQPRGTTNRDGGLSHSLVHPSCCCCHRFQGLKAGTLEEFEAQGGCQGASKAQLKQRASVAAGICSPLFA